MINGEIESSLWIPRLDSPTQSGNRLFLFLPNLKLIDDEDDVGTEK